MPPVASERRRGARRDQRLHKNKQTAFITRLASAGQSAAGAAHMDVNSAGQLAGRLDEGVAFIDVSPTVAPRVAHVGAVVSLQQPAEPGDIALDDRGRHPRGLGTPAGRVR